MYKTFENVDKIRDVEKLVELSKAKVEGILASWDEVLKHNLAFAKEQRKKYQEAITEIKETLDKHKVDYTRRGRKIGKGLFAEYRQVENSWFVKNISKPLKGKFMIVDGFSHWVNKPTFNYKLKYQYTSNIMEAYEYFKGEKVRKIEEAKENDKSLRELIKMQIKYDTSEDYGWDDILELLLEKDKYLRLAHYLMLNRGDWSDGYSYAENGLGSFSVECDLDQEIYDDIQGYIEDWDHDGRVFRDCQYNYDVLYNMVKDEALMKDYHAALEKVDLH